MLQFSSNFLLLCHIKKVISKMKSNPITCCIKFSMVLQLSDRIKRTVRCDEMVLPASPNLALQLWSTFIVPWTSHTKLTVILQIPHTNLYSLTLQKLYPLLKIPSLLLVFLFVCLLLVIFLYIIKTHINWCILWGTSLGTSVIEYTSIISLLTMDGEHLVTVWTSSIPKVCPLGDQLCFTLFLFNLL